MTNKILWVDLETTGTDEKTGKILEIGAIVTDDSHELNELAELSVVEPLKCPWQHLDTQVVFDMHMANGLIADCVAAYKDFNERVLGGVQITFHQFINEHFPKGKIPLAGSGVGHFDRRWIVEQLGFGSRLTYWSYDIGCVRRFLQLANVELPGYTAPENKAHRGLDDVKDHLAEARAALKFFRSLEP